MSVTINGSGAITFNDGSVQNTASLPGMRNRIINGAMQIDQRNAGASVNPNNDAYVLDRWQHNATQTSKYSVQQNAGSVTPPAGFVNYMGCTSLSAYTLTSGDTFTIKQNIEGLNLGDLAWGTANAQPVTLSFWVRSSLTGTFGGSLRNGAGSRTYPYSYTITSANTWEQKTITIAGDTTGTWQTNNGIGITLIFSLGTGSTFSGTAGAWSSSTFNSATGATSVVGTNGATFYITGVQLEKGSTATSFDYRPYSTELELCYRYCEVFNVPAGQFVIPVIPSGTVWMQILLGYMKTIKRVDPTMTLNFTMANASYVSTTPSSTGQWGLGNDGSRVTKTGTAAIAVKGGQAGTFALAIGNASFSGAANLLDFHSSDYGKPLVTASAEL